jgi:hypothetical protein
MSSKQEIKRAIKASKQFIDFACELFDADVEFITKQGEHGLFVLLMEELYDPMSAISLKNCIAAERLYEDIEWMAHNKDEKIQAIFQLTKRTSYEMWKLTQ